MNSILRHSAIALVAASLLTSGLVAYAMHQGFSPMAIVALALVGGTAVGTCITGSVYAILGLRHERLADSVGSRLARSLASSQQEADHRTGKGSVAEARHSFATAPANDDRRMARAA